MISYVPYQSEQNWVNAMTPFMGFLVMGLFMVAVCRGITKSLFEPEEEKFLPQTIRRVKFHRGDIDSAIEAAKKLKSDRDLYVFAIYSGYTIDKRPPPGMQRYAVVHPDGTTKTIDVSSLPGVIVMPTLPEEAREDFFFVEYIRDMLRLGERLSDEDVKFMWESWKKSRDEGRLRDEIRDFVRKYERDPFSPEAVAESERIETEANAAGLSDREFERLWTAEVTRCYETPTYMPQVTPEQIESLKEYWRLARNLAKSAREAAKR